MAKKLTPEMYRLIEFMELNGGKVKRFPGGFWGSGKNGGWFGTSTVQALVFRGMAEYSDWKVGRGGRFPIEAKLMVVSGE
jgi:hypothetical protein